MDYTALIVGISALITAVGAVIVNIINANAAARKADKSIELSNQVLTKTSVIEGHVNSQATLAASKIEALQKELDQKNALLADKDKVAAVLASNQSQKENK